MNLRWRNLFTVFRKELTDTLRDRRSLVSMFVVPTLVMPVLMLGIAIVSVKVVGKARDESPAVMIVGAKDSPAVRAALESNERLRLVPFAPDYKARIAAKTLRAAVEIPDDFDAALAAGRPAAVTICLFRGEFRSEDFAAGELERFFGGYRNRLVRERLAARGLEETFLRPFEVRRENVAPPAKVGGNLYGGLVPYLLILLSFTGAMYPAIDLTAGEKERGTMETILCSPVGRTELVLGKFLLVLMASLATVACSLGSMLATAQAGSALLTGKALGAAGGLPAVSWPGVLGVCALVLPLAVLFSAILLAISLFARSHKEAQSYASPLIFIVILPAVGAVLPGVELNAKLALVPILNVALAGKEMVAGQFPAGMLALIFGSTSLYAAAALALAVRMFNRESVLFRT
ncbi:MAG: ABC transporter permease [Opitutaceae bacterium]|jgi:sodium transport system permease protein|nr:ABC transporter permease [Opitutaceae bacterium]